MKKFHETYDLTNRETLHGLITFIGETHEAIQQLEAGIEGTTDDKATASFMFLDLVGYLPNVLSNGRKLVKVKSKALAAEADRYFVYFEMENGDLTRFPIFGATSGAKAVMAGANDLKAIIKAAFPKAVIQTTTGKSKSGETTYHTTVRPDFMQRSEARGYPVESGSAECSNASVSLMQATVRMIAAHVMGAMGAAMAIDLHRAIKPKTKTFGELVKEAMDSASGQSLIKQITEPNKLLEGLKFDRSPGAKAARHAASYSMGTKRSARDEVEDLIDNLKAMGIDVQVISI